MSCIRKETNGVYYYYSYCLKGCEKHPEGGKQHGRSLHVGDGKTALSLQKDLDRAHEEQRRAVLTGKPITTAVNYTLAQFIAAYAEKHRAIKSPSENTIQNYEYCWLHFMRHLGEERLLKSLTRDDMEGYYKRAHSELSIHTLYSRRRTLNALFNDAVKRGWLEASPMQYFPDVPQEQTDIEPIDREIIAKLPTINDEPWATLMLAVYLSGCRISDFCKLRRRWVDRRERRLRFEETKEKRTRYLYLTDDLLACLDKLERMSENLEYVVTFRGEPVNRNQCYKHFIEIGEKLGAHINPHALRHSRATHLADDGATPKDIKNLLGHSSLKTTERYFHETEGRQKEIAPLLSMRTAMRREAM